MPGPFREKLNEIITSRSDEITLAGIMLIGWFVRYQEIMRSELIPGINGMYYPVQVRSILQTGALGLPDFPLLFYFEAVIAFVASKLTADVNSAILSTSRWVDTLFPVFILVPIYWFVRAFSSPDTSKNARLAAIFIVGLIAVLNSSVLLMAVDFQKNAVGLPLSLAAVYSFHQAIKYRKRKYWLGMTIFLSATALVHQGIISLTVITLFLITLFSLIAQKNNKELLVTILGAGTTVIASLSIVYLFDPGRIDDFVRLLLDPGKLFDFFSISTIINQIRMMWSLGFPHLGILLGSIGLILVAVQYRKIGPANSSLLLGASVGSVLFALPWMAVEWSQRMAMMSFLPGLIPLVYLVVRRRWGWALGSILLVFVMLNSVQAQLARPQQVLSKEAYRELMHIKGTLPGGQNLVYAPHGLEWWVAWTMETDITNQVEIGLNSIDHYDHTFFVEQNNASAYEMYHGIERFFPTTGNTSSSYLPIMLPTLGNTVSLRSSVNQIDEIYQGNYFTLEAVKR